MLPSVPSPLGCWSSAPAQVSHLFSHDFAPFSLQQAFLTYTGGGSRGHRVETWGCVSCQGGWVGISSWQSSTSWKYLLGAGTVTLIMALSMHHARHGTMRTTQSLRCTTLVMHHLDTNTSSSSTHYFWDALPREQAPFGQHIPRLHWGTTRWVLLCSLQPGSDRP